MGIFRLGIRGGSGLSLGQTGVRRNAFALLRTRLVVNSAVSKAMADIVGWIASDDEFGGDAGGVRGMGCSICWTAAAHMAREFFRSHFWWMTRTERAMKPGWIGFILKDLIREAMW